MQLIQVELPGIGWLFSEGRADARLQLEQQLLERLALKTPLVSKLYTTILCEFHYISVKHMRFAAPAPCGHYSPAFSL